MKAGRSLVRVWHKVALPFRLVAWLPYFVTRTVTGAVLGSVSGVGGLFAGLFGAALGLAIAIPVTVFVVGLVLVIVPLVLVTVGVATLAAVMSWPLRRARWTRGRRLLEWQYWDEPEEPKEE